MPELAEVERSCRLVRQHCLGKVVKVVICKEQGGGPREGLYDDKVFAESIEENTFASNVKGSTLKSVHRRGKQFWFELVKDKNGKKEKKKLPEKKTCFALLHFGMTGSFSVKGVDRDTYKEFKVDKSWPPKFCKLELIFGSSNPKKNIHLAFTDPRRLGRIRFRFSDPVREPPLSTLGSDPVLCPVTFKEFELALSNRSVAVKAILLNQNGPFCGIGNWIADEVLYQARVHPSAITNSLTVAQLQAIYKSILEVCNKAVEVNAESDKFPPNWIFHYRWSKRERTAPKIGGKSIKFETVAGRTSAIVPSVQKMGAKRKKKSTDGNEKTRRKRTRTRSS